MESVAVKKESESILYNRLKHCTKEIFRLLTIASIALFIIIAIVFVKYNPVYAVKINDEIIGYVKSKTAMEEKINNELLTSDNPCAVFSELTVEPTYELVLSDVEAEDDDKIAEMLSENIKTMYKVYAVTINNEIETYVNTVEEAETIVAEMQSEYSEDVAKVGIQEQYTTDFESVGTQSLEVAKLSVDTDLRGIKTEQERIAEATFNGVYFSVKPVVGNITSRYGVVETSVRNHAHGGLDIAAPYGTSIKAAADGTISYSGWMSGYGYLIIIDHANGVQTYYGHCSKLYASVGDEVTAGDVIAAVGSTGNSTGNHLHLEIRLNGNKINPLSPITDTDRTNGKCRYITRSFHHGISCITHKISVVHIHTPGTHQQSCIRGQFMKFITDGINRIGTSIQ